MAEGDPTPRMRTRFADFVMDTGTRELLRGEEVEHLSTTAFLLLELLIRRAPTALSKDEMAVGKGDRIMRSGV